jgi:hypothetical protein
MAKKVETIEELARAEAEEIRLRAERAAKYLVNSERLAKDMPPAFLNFADAMRDAVKRFNEACDPQKRFNWRESAAVASRDSNPHADFNLTFGRADTEITVVLKEMGRSGPRRPDVYVFEGNGRVADRSFFLRVEGQIPENDVEFRVTVDFQKTTFTYKEFPEMLLRSLIKRDVDLLYPKLS